jgi:hypothetical protein
MPSQPIQGLFVLFLTSYNVPTENRSLTGRIRPDIQLHLDVRLLTLGKEYAQGTLLPQIGNSYDRLIQTKAK